MCYLPSRPASPGERSLGRIHQLPLFSKPLIANGPVAQGIEQQPSKLKVPGSNPGGVANNFNYLADPRALFLVARVAKCFRGVPSTYNE